LTRLTGRCSSVTASTCGPLPRRGGRHEAPTNDAKSETVSPTAPAGTPGSRGTQQTARRDRAAGRVTALRASVGTRRNVQDDRGSLLPVVRAAMPGSGRRYGRAL